MSSDILELDDIALYFGDDYVINDKIKIHQPTVDEIVRYGEKDYYSMISVLTSIPSDHKSMLYDMGLDWEEMSDFELFMLFAPTLSQEQTQIVLGDVNFQDMQLYMDKVTEQPVMADLNKGIKVDMLIYKRIANYLCKVHGIVKKPEYAYNNFTKKILIEEDRENLKFNKNKPYKSFLLPVISSVKVRMGYTKDYIRNMGIYELMDDIERLSVIVNTDALLNGCYSGMVDTSKIKKAEFNWMRDLSQD